MGGQNKHGGGISENFNKRVVKINGGEWEFQ